jgi:hypothetical protein
MQQPRRVAGSNPAGIANDFNEMFAHGHPQPGRVRAEGKEVTTAIIGAEH